MAAPVCLSQIINSKWHIILQKRCYHKKCNYRSHAYRHGHVNSPVGMVPHDTGIPDMSPAVNVVMGEKSLARNEIINSVCKRDGSIGDGILGKGIVAGGQKEITKLPFHHAQVRGNSGWNPKGLPHLMDIPEIVWPGIFKSLKNRILASFIIAPYFDREFSVPEFVTGSKQAVELVSNCLAKGDCESLIGLLTDDALREVKRNIEKFNDSQRRELKVTKDDIYFAFPYEIGVMFNDVDEKTQKRFVEITMVYHVLRGLKEMKDKDVNLPLNLGSLPEYQDKLQLLNYRFIREFTKGVEDDWSVSGLNHFKPIDKIDSA